MNISRWVSKRLSITENQFNKFVVSCPYRYKKYKIRKRHGNGYRSIAQPAKSVKNIQRVVYGEFFADLPIHKSATAYRKGMGIKANVLPHVTNQYHLKMDFRDFFPSIRPASFVSCIEKSKNVELSESDKLIISRLFFYLPSRNSQLVLSIGAPTSPAISNSVLFYFDQAISEYCCEHSITYTRYADDLTFSTNQEKILFDVPTVVLSTVQDRVNFDLEINHDKTVFTSKKFNRHITGLVVTNDGKISIGRKNKRKVKALIHQHITNQITGEDLLYLRGYISFCRDVEPSFLLNLEKKYGLNTISSICDP